MIANLKLVAISVLLPLVSACSAGTVPLPPDETEDALRRGSGGSGSSSGSGSTASGETTVGDPSGCQTLDAGVGQTDAATPNLKWYRTCGYPVCRGDGDPVSPPACPPEGSPCTQQGQTCGVPSDENCGAILVCDARDPKLLGCPISSAKFKDNIHYLDANDLQNLHRETMGIQLTTYRYKGQFADPNVPHLGFIIEDAPMSSAVDRGHDRVDMYGYFSMLVASMQVQEREIARLKGEVARLKNDR